MEEIHCVVSGRVQMVMFRDFVKRKARALGLTGWVKNLDDNTVEVLAQGEKKTLEQLIARMRRGSLLSNVEDVRVEWRSPKQSFEDFHIVY